MKKINYIFVLLLLFSSCSNLEGKKPLRELFSEDFKKFKAENEIEVVDLDTVKNFSELRKIMSKITCEGKVSGLKFNLNDTRYHITGFSDCPTSGEIGCYFRRNFISIRNDSIIIEFENENIPKPISYLKTEMKNIIDKPNSFQYNENKVKPALIYLYIENQYPISTTKKVLKEIAEQFDSINSKNTQDFFKYNILFVGFDISNLQPPPPPTNLNKLKTEMLN